ncbi:MAG: hypothetical protein PQJ44_09195 [Sphaerochaetaceae bacterium]|nr:hypothetical protein [Sphaerochaetaceae bacterium]
MGSKNRRKLGNLSNIFLHKIRNVFSEDIVYITDNKIKKLNSNRPELNKYFEEKEFQTLIDNVKKVYYNEEDKIYNCLTESDGKLFIFGIVSKNVRNEVTTLFITNDRQIDKKFPNDNNLIEF